MNDLFKVVALSNGYLILTANGGGIFLPTANDLLLHLKGMLNQFEADMFNARRDAEREAAHGPKTEKTDS